MARPKQERLPGTGDAKLQELHDAAIEYAEVRDARMRANQEETGLKAKLLGLMKKFHKETYSYEGVEINIVHEEETVKVRITKTEEGEEVAAD